MTTSVPSASVGAWLLVLPRPAPEASSRYFPQAATVTAFHVLCPRAWQPRGSPPSAPCVPPGFSLPPLHNLVLNRVNRAHWRGTFSLCLQIYWPLGSKLKIGASNQWVPGSPSGWSPSDARTKPEFGGMECFDSARGSLGISTRGQPCFHPGILDSRIQLTEARDSMTPSGRAPVVAGSP